MPWNFFRPARPGASPVRRRQQNSAWVRTLALGFLFLYIGLIWAGPLLLKSPDSWVVGRTGRGSQATGELVLPRDDNEQGDSGASSNIVFRDFDLVDALGRIIDHPRQFLKARYVTTARVLSEGVTAPMFAKAEAPLLNRTIDLPGWLYEDTLGICRIIIPGTRNAIVALVQQRQRCGTADSATSEHPAGDDAAERFGPQDVRCSADNVQKQDSLLRSAQGLEASMKVACDEILPRVGVFTGIFNSKGGFFSSRQSLLGLLEEIKDSMKKMDGELEFLRKVIDYLDRSDFAISEPPEEILQHLRHRGDTSGLRLDVLASRAATGYPGDLDPFTALLLHIVHGTSLLSSSNILLDRIQVKKSPNETPTWPTKMIRYELREQANMINTTTELLDTAILPGAREWLSLMREVNDTSVLKTSIDRDPAHGDDMGIDFDDRWWEFEDSLRSWWADSNKANRMVKAVEDGADRLEFLRGYLVQLQPGLPGLLTRLDRWDAEVTQLADDLTLVLLWGKKYTGRRHKQGNQRPQRHRPHKDGSSGNSGGGDGELEITRWQIHPSSTQSILKGLYWLESELKESLALSESFNPQDSWQDNWFETQMDRWNSKRAALRAEWEVEQAHKERARRTFWQHFGDVMGISSRDQSEF